VSYTLDGPVATITMDDGKVNVMSRAMQLDIEAALEQAESDQAIVVLTGRAGVFSAGFDLKTLTAGGAEAIAMLRGGFELAARVLSYPYPVVTASPGHAIAMGFFLLQSGDYVIGADGPFRLVANEVAIGLPVPRPAMAILRQRLTPAAFARSVMLAEQFAPSVAVGAGVLDLVVDPDAVAQTATDVAATFSALDMNAHVATKRIARAATLEAITAGIELEYGAAPLE
jgi:enoyl-CoA hydratase